MRPQSRQALLVHFCNTLIFLELETRPKEAEAHGIYDLLCFSLDLTNEKWVPDCPLAPREGGKERANEQHRCNWPFHKIYAVTPSASVIAQVQHCITMHPAYKGHGYKAGLVMWPIPWWSLLKPCLAIVLGYKAIPLMCQLSLDTTVDLTGLCRKRDCFAKHQPGVAGCGWLQPGRNFLST